MAISKKTIKKKYEYQDGKLISKKYKKAVGSLDNNYLMIRVDGFHTTVHRIIWIYHNGDIPKGMEIHHINSNKLDNRIENLSLVTSLENKLKYDQVGKGYYFDKIKNNWRACRQHNKTKYNLGNFFTKCGAYMASKMFYVNKGKYYGNISNG